MVVRHTRKREPGAGRLPNETKRLGLQHGGHETMLLRDRASWAMHDVTLRLVRIAWLPRAVGTLAHQFSLRASV